MAWNGGSAFPGTNCAFLWGIESPRGTAAQTVYLAGLGPTPSGEWRNNPIASYGIGMEGPVVIKPGPAEFPVSMSFDVLPASAAFLDKALRTGQGTDLDGLTLGYGNDDLACYNLGFIFGEMDLSISERGVLSARCSGQSLYVSGGSPLSMASVYSGLTEGPCTWSEGSISNAFDSAPADYDIRSARFRFRNTLVTKYGFGATVPYATGPKWVQETTIETHVEFSTYTPLSLTDMGVFSYAGLTISGTWTDEYSGHSIVATATGNAPDSWQHGAIQPNALGQYSYSFLAKEFQLGGTTY
jgi:hypothetical protein